jgi:hypothetical protein
MLHWLKTCHRINVLVKLSGGRLVQATVKAIRETTDGVRLQVSFGEETALVYLWQIVIETR